MAMGGWQDPATGAGELDVAVLTPQTPEGLTAAAHIASEGQQAAIGELGPSAGNPYIGDITLPEDLHRGSGVWEEADGGIDPRVIIGTASDPDITVITPSRKEATEVWATDLAAEKYSSTSDLPEATLQQRMKKATEYLKKNRGPLP
jgi:hypothetical protein